MSSKVEIGDKVLFNAIKEHDKEIIRRLVGVVKDITQDKTEACVHRVCYCSTCEEQFRSDKKNESKEFKGAIWTWWIDTKSCRLIEKTQMSKDEKKLLEAVRNLHKAMGGTIESTVETINDITSKLKS